MPRPRRHDLEPEILVPDTSAQERRANEAIDENFSAKVRRRGESPIQDRWMIATDELERQLAHHRRAGTSIPAAFLWFLVMRCDSAHAAPKLDANREPEIRDGHRVLNLRRIGCRVRMTEKQMAEDFCASQSTIERHVRKLKALGFIVNGGHGWVELDAALCWRGDLNLLAAYRNIQTISYGPFGTDNAEEDLRT